MNSYAKTDGVWVSVLDLARSVLVLAGTALSIDWLVQTRSRAKG